MFDLPDDVERQVQLESGASSGDVRGKRGFDIVCAALLLLPLAVVALCLAVLNPVLNPGPVFFRQIRMGRNCAPFVALKFRTMTVRDDGNRGAFDAVELARVTCLGWFLRRTRVDELPQILNVLCGEMSMIGPRPDAYGHAQVYLRDIPGYRRRHKVRPGITGYAQTEVGYVETLADMQRKVAADLAYLADPSWRMDL